MVIPKSVKSEIVPDAHWNVNGMEVKSDLDMLSIEHIGVEKPIFPKLKLNNES